MGTVHFQMMLFFLNMGICLANLESGSYKVAVFNSFVAGFCIAVAATKYCEIRRMRTGG